jgi:hypothetical protein
MQITVAVWALSGGIVGLGFGVAHDLIKKWWVPRSGVNPHE